MKNKITMLSASLAPFLVCALLSYPSCVWAELGAAAAPTGHISNAAPLAAIDLNTATATVVNGHVIKALARGSNSLSPPTPCKVGDLLNNGSVVQTGKETGSSAELKWGQGKVTRIWKDSTIRIFCAHASNIDTVCINKGALIFRKDKKDPGYYYLETKLLQARIHGTTVRLQSKPPVDGKDGLDKILVLEGGPVQVKNKETGSVVQLTVGVELEVKCRASYKCNDKRFDIPDYSSAAAGDTGGTYTASKVLPDYRLNPNKGELILDDRTSSILAYTANPKAFLEDPMIVGSSKSNISPLESLDLIKSAMKRLPEKSSAWNRMLDDVINFGRPDKYIINNLKISRVPDGMYTVGPNVGQASELKPITLPYTDHTPAARFDFNQSSHIASAGIKAPIQQIQFGHMPITETAAQDPMAQDPAGQSQAVQNAAAAQVQPGQDPIVQSLTAASMDSSSTMALEHHSPENTAN